MQDPFIAVDAGTDLAAHARALRRSWEATLSGAPAAAPVRDVISQSWSRMTGAGLDPDHLQPRRALARDEVGDVRAASPLAAALPALRRCLGDLSQDSEHVMVITDADGRILWLEGHPGVRARADRIAFEEGMLWTEDSAGTNAIGTALAIDRAVQVFSAEHFLAEQHAWWCSAAPIHDPATGAVLGVVDVSGPMRTAHPHSLALVNAAAEVAEAILRFRLVAEAADRAAERLQLRVLGRGPAIARLGAAAPVELAPRHAEILVLLALHPDGLTAEQLTLQLYGEAGNRISTRAEMSRLRKLLGPALAAKPYRLTVPVEADFLEVEALLARGDLAGALAAFRGSLLPGSEAPRVVEARDELEGALQRAALGGSPQALWAWVQSDAGRDDALAMAAFLRRAAAGDPHRPLVAARLSALRRRWSAYP